MIKTLKLTPRSNQMTSETDLIEGCLKDDRRMQEELYQRFSPRMYAVCLRYAGNADEAQDVLQDGFIKVFKKWTVSGARVPLKAGCEEYS